VSTEPFLSVIVTITSGAPNLGRCLKALEGQRNAPPTEILVPVYKDFDEVAALRSAHPTVRFVPVEGDAPGLISGDPGLLHLSYDRRRATGLAAARGELIAMTEDHAIPVATWCSDIAEVHRKPYAAIGGAIDNASPRWLTRAAYFCDFGRYANPLEEGPAHYVSDINVSYKRAAVEKTRHVWQRYYHETAVHAALEAASETLWLTPRIVVRHDRGTLRFWPLLQERFAWARLFAGRRAAGAPLLKRAVWILFSPLLPALLAARRAVEVVSRGRNRGALLAAFPLMLVLMAAQAAGEFTGYVTAKPTRNRQKQDKPERSPAMEAG